MIVWYYHPLAYSSELRNTICPIEKKNNADVTIRTNTLYSSTTSMLTIPTLNSCSSLFDSSLLFALSLKRLCKKKVVCRNFRQTTKHGALKGKTQSLQSASQKVQKLSEIQECLAKKLAKSVYFSLFNSEIEWNIRENL